MNTDDKIKLFAKMHNMRRSIHHEEIQPFFEDGYACVQHGAYLAACLCFITGIEMSLRLPLLLKNGGTIKDAYKVNDVPLLKNRLLLLAKEQGRPVEVLRYDNESEESFLANLSSNEREDAVKIVQLRNNICHGNLNFFVREVDAEERIYAADFKEDALQLERILLAWSKVYLPLD